MKFTFGIIGNGSWATAIAKMLTDNHHPIQWWVRNANSIDHMRKRHHNPHYLSSAYFDTKLLHLNDDIATVVAQSNVVIVAVPSAFVADALQQLAPDAFEGKLIISAVKGILPDEVLLLNEYLSKYFNVKLDDYFALLGPCHAEEVAAEKLSYLTFTGERLEMAQELAACFATPYINTTANNDIWGVQYAAVLKNIYALGAGIAHGLDYGDNFLSVYIANAANEMVRFLQSASEHSKELHGSNACAKTMPNYWSSVYLGDLLVTCYSLYSRNRTFGNMIGKGYSVRAAQLEMSMVAEGYNASRCVHEVNKKIGIEIPMVESIYEILWQQLPAYKGFERIEQIMI